MDNITRQNQFYESQVIKQENESGYERRPLEMEQQQAYRPGGKVHMYTSFEGNKICTWLIPSAESLSFQRDFASSSWAVHLGSVPLARFF